MRNITLLKLIIAGLSALDLAACGQTVATPPDARVPTSKPADTAIVAVVACDPSVTSEEAINECIINPADDPSSPALGGGTIIARIEPIAASTCK